MADISKIKRNISKMLDQGAPEADVDAYLKAEGVTPMDLRIKGNESILDDPAETGWFRTLVDQFNQGTLSGWGDEVTDRMAAAGVDPFVDESYDELLDQARTMSKRDLAAQKKENPWLSGGANIAGALTGATALRKVLPNGVQTKAAEFAKANPATAAMLTGGGGAGIYSAGSSEKEGLERLDNLATDVPIGMAGGYAGHRIAQALPTLAKNIDDRFSVGDKARAAGRALGILDDAAPAAADDVLAAADDVAAQAAPQIDPLALSPTRLAGILDEGDIANLETGNVLPLTLGDKTQDVLQQRAEQTAATFGTPDSPINLARRTQKDAMQKPFRAALGEDQLFDDVALSGRAQDEAENAANIIRGQYDDLGRRVSKAYDTAREMGEGVFIRAGNVQDDFLDSTRAMLADDGLRRGDIPALDSHLDDLQAILTPKDGNDFTVSGVKLKELELWKKRLNRTISDTGIDKKATLRNLKMVGQQYDEFLSNLADDAIVNGDETAIKAFQEARGLAKEKFSFEESDRAIKKILDNRDLSGTQLVNTIMGATKLGGTGEGGRLAETMLTLAGDKAPAMQAAMKRGYMAKILQDSIGRTPDSRSVFDMAGAMQKSLNGLMKNREAFETIFDDTEQKYFKQLSEDLGKIAGKQIGAINRSGSGTYTAEAMSGLGKVFSNPLFNAVGGLVRVGMEKKAAAEIIGKAEAGLDDFITEAIKQADAPAVYYGAYGGQAAVDPLFNAVGQSLYGGDE